MDVSASELAPVYLDDQRVRLQGDPRPSVGKVLQAGGRPQVVQVIQVTGDVETGKPMPVNEVIDRSRRKEPIYLRCIGPGGAHASFAPDEDFGAARTGMAGQGAQGTKERGRLGDPAVTPKAPAQAKSDFVGGQGKEARKEAAPGTDPNVGPRFPGQKASEGQEEGGSNQSYGQGDLAPGGRTSADGARGVGIAKEAGHEGPPQGSIAGSGERVASLASRAATGGSGESRQAGAAGVAGDEGIGANNRRQAGLGTASGVDAPENQAQGGVIRDQSTDRAGRQQGQD